MNKGKPFHSSPAETGDKILPLNAHHMVPRMKDGVGLEAGYFCYAKTDVLFVEFLELSYGGRDRVLQKTL